MFDLTMYYDYFSCACHVYLCCLICGVKLLEARPRTRARPRRCRGGRRRRPRCLRRLRRLRANIGRLDARLGNEFWDRHPEVDRRVAWERRGVRSEGISEMSP